MEFIEENGDLFLVDQTKYVFAHCISADVTDYIGMGKGIAKIFRRKYPRMAAEITNNIKIGKAIRYQYQSEVIYNLITKNCVFQNARSFYRSTYYGNLQSALIDLRNQMLVYHEEYVAMPQIGCGLDECEWRIVKSIIQQVFADTSIHILIRSLI